MKKEKKLIMVIVVLSVLLLGSVGYICFDKFVLKDNDTEIKDNNKKDEDTDNEKEEDNEEEIRSLTADEEEMFLEKILDYNRGLSFYYPISDMSKIENFDLY